MSEYPTYRSLEPDELRRLAKDVKLTPGMEGPRPFGLPFFSRKKISSDHINLFCESAATAVQVRLQGYPVEAIGNNREVIVDAIVKGVSARLKDNEQLRSVIGALILQWLIAFALRQIVEWIIDNYIL
jgi:hypothetical protein